MSLSKVFIKARLAAATALSGSLLASSAGAMPKSFYDNSRDSQIGLTQKITTAADDGTAPNRYSNPGDELILSGPLAIFGANPSAYYGGYYGGSYYNSTYDDSAKADEIGLRYNLHANWDESNGGAVMDIAKRGFNLTEATLEGAAMRGRLRLGIMSDLGEGYMWRNGPGYGHMVRDDNSLAIPAQLGAAFNMMSEIPGTNLDLTASASMTWGFNELRTSVPDMDVRAKDSLTVSKAPSFTLDAGVITTLPGNLRVAGGAGFARLQAGPVNDASETRVGLWGGATLPLLYDFAIKAGAEMTQQFNAEGVSGRNVTTAKASAMLDSIFSASSNGSTWFSAYAGVSAASRNETKPMPQGLETLSVITQPQGGTLGAEAGAKLRAGSLELGLGYAYTTNSREGKAHNYQFTGKFYF